jgi:WD40 repeat protein
LAGTVWLALCGAAWWALPVRPRAVLGGEGPLAPIAFSPDGRRLIAADQATGGTPLTVDVATGQQVGFFQGEVPSVQYARYSPDSRWLLTSAVQDRTHLTYRLWNAHTGAPHGRLSDCGSECCFVPARGEGEPLLAIQNGGGGIALREVPSLREVGVLPQAVGEIAASADGRYVAAWAHQYLPRVDEVVVWELPSLRRVAAFPFNADREHVHRLIFSPDGNRLAAFTLSRGALQDTLWVWEVPRGEGWHLHGARPSRWRNNEELFAQTAGALSTYDGATGAKRAELSLESYRSEPQFTPDGATVLVGGPWLSPASLWLLWLQGLGISLPWHPELDWAVDVLDVATGRRLAQLPEASGVVASPDSRTLAVSRDGRIELWDLPPRKPLTWLVIAAALLALPLAWLARRRVRRLRRTMA